MVGLEDHVGGGGAALCPTRLIPLRKQEQYDAGERDPRDVKKCAVHL